MGRGIKQKRGCGGGRRLELGFESVKRVLKALIVVDDGENGGEVEDEREGRRRIVFM